jgi:hypothetical protein
MKDRFAHSLLIVLATLSMAGFAQAQVVQLPGGLDAKLSGHCETVENSRSNHGSIGDFRVKRGGQVTVTGVRQTIFIEEGGIADIRGTASLVYVAKGGKATISGERNTVYAERGGNVVTVGKVPLNFVDTITLHLHQSGNSCQ